MTETNIFKFRNWIYTKKIPNLEMEIRCIHFEEGETRTKSIVVDITNKKYVGRFTMWEDNSCVMELIDIESENNILFDRFEFSEFDDFKAKYNELLSFFT
ncbi:immunity protein TriTu family protein [Capnocytophaga stomatis]|uniref:Uncharacterized protein n=1 Tax=Capnocytophaga stomatis TaxID=1848904 RepID=A0A250G1T5_9FLAO|nr:hypothetical protein [Capnocytophaga stomatis]ATA90147.1 hypothetical protein CGC58_10680 [Capnocytophaga stomatis]GIJ94994.1 hypothetical protein CAPN002_22120 [Capnocytophaga stomatis]GIJ95532.1 hypothetical protein CAPN001_01010 [Capnocytophaga stomatis]GIM49727.1 hypothetical protein CAPN003_11790 [Capnocytophaga stomatis]